VLGHRETPGRPALYGTTREFLDYFNLKNLGDLPPLAALRDLDTIGAELDRRQSPEPAPGTTPDLFAAPPVPEASG
jgi:segregation and condensation protein B